MKNYGFTLWLYKMGETAYWGCGNRRGPTYFRHQACQACYLTNNILKHSRLGKPLSNFADGDKLSIFEAIMLICFGAAWPVNILKSWRTRSAIGKSWGFLVIVSLGYLSGIAHKIIYNPDAVMILYIINLIMVNIDLGLYIRNRKLDKMVASGA